MARSPSITNASRAQFTPLWVKVGFWLSVVIATGAVLRRLAALAHPSVSGPPELRSLDTFFANQAALTRAHIIPALAFVLLVGPVLFGWLRAAWTTRLLYGLGFAVGVTAYLMSVHSVGGWTERSAVLLFNSLFLFALGNSLRYYLWNEQGLQRRWLLRAVAILLGIATTRPVMGLFFATSPLTHLAPSQFFGIAFWIGFSANTIAVELWLASRNLRAKRSV